MRLLIFTILFACLPHLSAAQTADQMLGPVDLTTPENAVYSLMRGMYQGDTDMIDQVMLEDGVFRRALPDGQVTQDGLSNWKSWVGTLEIGTAHEELFSVDSLQYGNMATVWAPFVISVNGRIANCGVNTMTLANTDGDWKIVFGMDTPAPKDSCHSFKATYSKP